ncbi:MAG: NAD kinase [Proteiniphilum sp.]|jgi:NAD+ kinase|nr:NAD kinase [Proteiniphilum sp.]NCB24579.1 NAD kinase [Bacteroidia bacterium]MDD2938019.1 NAD kinase [Proteiniphilum sp.]MDD3075818.1 NAD kinase [Proteiniphilum sp.]MDD3956042.1 NAD kinase [Proteiniphilum sp.]
MKFALFGSMFPDRTAKAEEQIFGVCEAIKRHGGELILPENFFLSLPGHIQQKVGPLCELAETLPQVDMVVSVGGDGTFLRTATTVGDSGIPVLGINTGRLGFLAAINYSDVEETLQEVMDNSYNVQERTLLKMSTDEAFPPEYFNNHALNEVALLKQDTASMLSIHAYINNDYLTSYQADGLIISTPTGSTAYSLSIGGSILSPTIPSIILSPIAPHNLTSRSLVVDDSSIISLKVESRSHMFLVSVDGQSRVLDETVNIQVRKDDYTLRVVKRLGHTFYQTLRDKLMWGADVRKK